jgi:hypothetical protein
VQRELVDKHEGKVTYRGGISICTICWREWRIEADSSEVTLSAGWRSYFMLMQLFWVVLTSLLTTALTLVVAWFVFDRFLKARYWSEIDAQAQEIGQEFKAQVSEGVREGIANGLTDLRDKAARKATQTPIDLLEESLNLWLGGRRPEK